MDAEWAATIFGNFAVLACLIACRPSRSRFLWLYVALCTVADWFFFANLQHLHGEAYNLPWSLWFDLMVASEAAALIEMCCNATECATIYAALALMVFHLALCAEECIVWERYVGKYLMRLELNRPGWEVFHQRQLCKVMLAVALCAVILQMRHQREGEPNARREAEAPALP